MYLRVKAAGRYWRMDYRVNGKAKTLALGAARRAGAGWSPRNAYMEMQRDRSIQPAPACAAAACSPNCVK
jgi:hypothetical protein